MIRGQTPNTYPAPPSTSPWKAAGAGAASGLLASLPDWNNPAQQTINAANKRNVPYDVAPIPPLVPGYEQGGMVRRTGLAKVHKGEYVIPRKKVKQMSRNLLAAY